MLRHPKGLVANVRAHLRHKGLGRKHYELADQFMDRILKETEKPAELVVTLRKEKKVVRIVDNHRDKEGNFKNAAFRQHGIKQFEFKVEEA